jgi:hypothetical protein
MAVIQLIHWNEKEAHLRSLYLQSQGHIVHHTIPSGKKLRTQIVGNETELIIISLERLPAQGRDTALWLRKQASTRTIPIAFVEGLKTKVSAIQELLPDAAFHSWKTVATAIESIITTAPKRPIVPDSVFAAYRSKPLSVKLGIKPGMYVCLLDAQADDTLRKALISDEARSSDTTQKADIILCFVTTKAAMITHLAMLDASEKPIWFCWPKRASRMGSELTQQIVRETGLAAGYVDYKICSIDTVWSGLLFRRRKFKA